MYAVEDALVELARKAGSFMVTLVEQVSITTFADSDSMNSVIEGLRKCVLTTFVYYISSSRSDKELHSEMNRVLEVVNKISSQRSPTRRLLLSAFDKAAIDECNRQLALACGYFGVRKSSATSESIRSCQIVINQIRSELRSSHNKPSPELRPS